MSFRNSSVILAKGIKMDREYNNLLKMSSDDVINSILLTDNYFVASQDVCSYIREGEFLQVSIPISKCKQANYLAFRNPDYENRWFFAWIDSVQYINDGCTRITYTVDSFTTFYSNITWKACHVVREHVVNDTIGANTIDENLNIGEYITDGSIESLDGFSYSDVSNICVAFTSTFNPVGESGVQWAGATVYNRNVYACPIFFCREDTLSDLKDSVSAFIQKCNDLGHIGDIKEVFYFPSFLLSDYEFDPISIESEIGTTGTYYEFPTTSSIEYQTQLFTRRNTFSDYQPLNNKVFVYPYNVLQVSNNTGNVKNFRYEDFENVVSGKVQFRFDVSLSVGCSGRIYPMNYKGKVYNLEEQLPLGKFPTINWASDTYTNWLTEQSVNKKLQAQKSPLSAIGQALGTVVSQIPRSKRDRTYGSRMASRYWRV